MVANMFCLHRTAVCVAAIWFVSTAPALAAPATEGEATLTVLTKSSGQQFAPRHVLAIWVEDSQGKFVRTLKYQAKNYAQYLVAWKQATRAEQAPLVDAVTGASLREHETHTVKWDCKDAAGNIVPDGYYHIRIEFSEKNGKGPVTPAKHIRFLKGRTGGTVKPRPLAYFKEIVVKYVPQKPGA